MMNEKRQAPKKSGLFIASLLLISVWGDSNVKPDASADPPIPSDSREIEKPPLPPFSRVEPMGGLDEGRGVTPEDEFQRIRQLREEFPKLAEILEETRRISLSIRNAALSYRQCDTPEKKIAWKNKTRELLKQEFDLEVERQYLEIEYLSKRIEKLKILIARFEKSQDAVLEYRLKKKLRDDDASKSLPFQPEKKISPSEENNIPFTEEKTPAPSAMEAQR
ncbi:MAG: hypothetical protein AB1656_03575 [Candidatus Omnitrophota bacterium]